MSRMEVKREVRESVALAMFLFIVCFRYWCLGVIAVRSEVLDFGIGGFVGRGEKVDGGLVGMGGIIWVM